VRAAFGPDRVVHETLTGVAARNPGLTEAAEVVAVVMHPWAVRGVVVVAALLAWRQGRTRVALASLAALVVGGVATTGLKELLARERPTFVTDLPREVAGTDFSMPSGHALTGALGLGLLLVLAWPALRERGLTRVAVAVALVLGALVCADRLVLGVHYLTDVLVGAGLGAAGAAVVATWGRGGRR
jgi:membrane-associated phospholipid phosphatase